MDSPDDAKREHWEALKRRLSLDDPVTGIVVRKEPYGAWLDVGGVPALLEIIFIDGLTPEKYRTGDWCPVGTTVNARILTFNDRDCALSLWQVLPDHLRKRWRQASDLPPTTSPISN